TPASSSSSSQQHQQQQQHQHQVTSAPINSRIGSPQHPSRNPLSELARLRNQLAQASVDENRGSFWTTGRKRAPEAEAPTETEPGTYRVDVFDIGPRPPQAGGRQAQTLTASSGGAAAAAQLLLAKRRATVANFDDIGGLAPSDLGLGSIGGGGYGGETFESMQLDSESGFCRQSTSRCRLADSSKLEARAEAAAAAVPSAQLSVWDVDRIDRAKRGRLKRLQRLQADACP
uniref:RPAP1_C domain-containing protein n=1 Tax=Macrostomum lignano TaxID=282301 RepID=A0A1I8FFB6_9PLAT